MCLRGIIEHIRCAGVGEQKRICPIARCTLDVGSDLDRNGCIISSDYLISYVREGRMLVYGGATLCVFAAHEYKIPNLELSRTRAYLLVELSVVFPLLSEHVGTLIVHQAAKPQLSAMKI